MLDSRLFGYEWLEVPTGSRFCGTHSNYYERVESSTQRAPRFYTVATAAAAAAAGSNNLFSTVRF